MKKALLIALCFILVGFMMVNGTFALPNLNDVFQAIVELGQNGFPEMGGAGTAVHVELVSDTEPQVLSPGSKASRVFHVENAGEGDVYFRLAYAVQYDAESWNHLTIRFDADDSFTEHNWQDITISGTPYKMKVFTYKYGLPAGTTSPGISISVAMDTTVTSEDLARYRSDFLQAQALAIDSSPFIEEGYSAETALDAVLPLEGLNPF